MAVYLRAAAKSTGAPVDCHSDKKPETRGFSRHPSAPLTPVDALEAGRVDMRTAPAQATSLCRSPPPQPAHTPAGCGHGGT